MPLAQTTLQPEELAYAFMEDAHVQLVPEIENLSPGDWVAALTDPGVISVGKLIRATPGCSWYVECTADGTNWTTRGVKTYELCKLNRWDKASCLGKLKVSSSIPGGIADAIHDIGMRVGELNGFLPEEAKCKECGAPLVVTMERHLVAAMPVRDATNLKKIECGKIEELSDDVERAYLTCTNRHCTFKHDVQMHHLKIQGIHY